MAGCNMDRKWTEYVKRFLFKYKEPLLYLFFGGLAFFLNLGVYAVSEKIFHHLAANMIAWDAGMIFAYVTNRIWVFKSGIRTVSGIRRELLSFSGGRLATFGLEELLLWIGIDIMGFCSMPVKIIAQVAVIIGNYVISKLIVFRKQ